MIAESLRTTWEVLARVLTAIPHLDHAPHDAAALVRSAKAAVSGPCFHYGMAAHVVVQLCAMDGCVTYGQSHSQLLADFAVETGSQVVVRGDWPGGGPAASQHSSDGSTMQVYARVQVRC
jgi:hypothetical protein